MENITEERDRYKAALERIAKGKYDVAPLTYHNFTYSELYSIAKEALNPPEEWIEEETEYWICLGTSTISGATAFHSLESAKEYGWNEDQLDKVLVKRKVKKPRPVTRREEISLAFSDVCHHHEVGEALRKGKNVSYFAEWQE